MHWLIWLSVGIVLGILELFTPGFFLVGVGVSMAIVAIPASLSMALWVQLLVLIISLVLFFLLIRPLVMKLPSSVKKSGADALEGEKGVVTEDIDPVEGGRVKVRGECWKASSDEKICKGEEVKVIDIEGVTLKVRRG